MERKILEFLKELRDSADIQYKIFTEGSCYKLFVLLKVVFPTAKAYWSDRCNHCITEIDGKYYDIGGKINKTYMLDNGYYLIPKGHEKGYKLLKWVDNKTVLSATVEKYKD